MAMQSQSDTPMIVLFGKLGHGKTCLVNILCGSDFKSVMCLQSCTQTIQIAYTMTSGISIIDTLGFCSVQDIVHHITQQKLALKGTALSGIYVIVQFGCPGEMVDILGKVMDFAGDDDIHIIITFTDVACQEPGYDGDGTKLRLLEQSDVDLCKITLVGKDMDHCMIESFIKSTLHAPKHFEVSKE